VLLRYRLLDALPGLDPHHGASTWIQRQLDPNLLSNGQHPG